MSFKRVLILARDVHDGEGNVFYKGDRPVLKMELADFLIGRGQAQEDVEITQAQAKRIWEDIEAAKIQHAEKERAEAVMRRHDMLPEDERIAAHDPQPDEPIEAANVVPMKKRGRPRRQG